MIKFYYFDSEEKVCRYQKLFQIIQRMYSEIVMLLLTIWTMTSVFWRLSLLFMNAEKHFQGKVSGKKLWKSTYVLTLIGNHSPAGFAL